MVVWNIFIFPYIGKPYSHLTHIFQRGRVETTNQNIIFERSFFLPCGTPGCWRELRDPKVSDRDIHKASRAQIFSGHDRVVISRREKRPWEHKRDHDVDPLQLRYTQYPYPMIHSLYMICIRKDNPTPSPVLLKIDCFSTIPKPGICYWFPSFRPAQQTHWSVSRQGMGIPIYPSMAIKQ